jgi:hypothetical protein
MTRSKWLAVAAVALSGCAPALKNPQGIALTQGTVLPTPAVPAVRANCRATLNRNGKTFRFDVWIECDSTHGRLDAMGPLNTPLASIVWTDSSWKTWLPGQGTLLRGTGSAMNLPVLDLRNVSPSLLVAPLLGRSSEVKGPIHALPPAKGQIAVLPASQDPPWALLLDGATGLPLRRQGLSQGKETEGLSFFDWTDKNGILVPGKIVRTTPDGQILELEVRHWERLDSIPRSHTILKVPATTDTISIGMQENGRKVFRIRASGGDSAIVVLPHGGAMGPADLDSNPSLQDTTSEEPDDTDIEDSVDVDSALPAVPVAKPLLKPSRKL